MPTVGKIVYTAFPSFLKVLRKTTFEKPKLRGWILFSLWAKSATMIFVPTVNLWLTDLSRITRGVSRRALKRRDSWSDVSVGKVGNNDFRTSAGRADPRNKSVPLVSDRLISGARLPRQQFRTSAQLSYPANKSTWHCPFCGNASISSQEQKSHRSCVQGELASATIERLNK